MLFTIGNLEKRAILIITYIIIKIFYKLHKETSFGNVTGIALLLIMYFAELLSGILEIISFFQRRNKRYKAQLLITENGKSILTRDSGVIKSKVTKYLYILLICFIDGFISLIQIVKIGFESYELENETIFYCFSFFVCITLCYFLLKFKIYRHHKVAIVIILVGIVFFFNYLIKEINIKNFIKYFLYTCASGVFYVLIKWLMNHKIITAYSILMWDGLFGLILSNILALICSHVKCEGILKTYYCKDDMVMVFKWTELTDYLDSFPEICKTFLLVVLLLLYNLNTLLIVKYYTPTHCCIAEFSFLVIYTIITSIRTKKSFEWNFFVGVLIILFGGLLYNEFIIINACGMSDFTNPMIKKRAKELPIIEQSEYNYYSQQDFEKDLNDSVVHELSLKEFEL